MKQLLLLFLLLVGPVAHAQIPTDVCATGDQLVINTSTKTYQCVTPGTQPPPAGSGTNMVIANASSTGTTINRLAKLTGAPSTAVITATSDTENAVGIVSGGAGTTGNAIITILGQATCDFDNATTAGNYFTISAITAGKCHDAGSSYPTSGATYGRVLVTNGSAGANIVELMTPDIAFQNAGNGKSKPGGSNTEFQYNDSGVFAGGSGLIYTKATNAISLPVGTVKIGSARLDISSTSSFGATGEFLRMGDNGTTFLSLFPGGMDFTAPSISQNRPILSSQSTWNNAGIVFQNIKTNITDTNSPTQATLVDLQVGSASKFLVYKSGIMGNAGDTRVATQFDKTNATLANVTGLTNTLAHSRSYTFVATLYYDADVTGGAKFAIGGTATGVIIYQINTICNATNLSVITSRQTAVAGSAGQAGCVAGFTTITGLITTTVTTGGGTLTVQFAQNTANGTSSVLVGSTFEIKEIL